MTLLTAHHPPFSPHPDIVGSVVLPILGAVPDGAIVLFSGLGADAQEQVAVGVGALAGSTIMLLTVPWFLSILGGRVDLDARGNAIYKQVCDDETGKTVGERIYVNIDIT